MARWGGVVTLVRLAKATETKYGVARVHLKLTTLQAHLIVGFLGVNGKYQTAKTGSRNKSSKFNTTSCQLGAYFRASLGHDNELC